MYTCIMQLLALEWLEVFSHSDNKWIQIDCATKNFQLMNDNSVDVTTPQSMRYPLYYVAVGHNYIIDISLRFKAIAPLSTIISQRQFYDIHTWFEMAMQEYRTRNNMNGSGTSIAEFRIHDTETAALKKKKKEMDKIIPGSQEAYKRHPLYCLEKWLGRYEALYPESPDVQGYCGDLPVYSRSAIKLLHTRDRWLKEGKKVRKDQRPYKIVKASHLSSQGTTELYGEWQADDFVPEVAIDGQVPKNERGQVDLYHAKMMPVGCVHIKNMPNISRLAKRLGIDYAPCMTGFEMRHSRSVPVIDGIIICKEFEDILKDAYVQNEEKRLEKLRKNAEQRALKNWRRLVLGLLTRRRIFTLYGKQLNQADDAVMSSEPMVSDEEADQSDADENMDDGASQKLLANGATVTFEKI